MVRGSCWCHKVDGEKHQLSFTGFRQDVLRITKKFELSVKKEKVVFLCYKTNLWPHRSPSWVCVWTVHVSISTSSPDGLIKPTSGLVWGRSGGSEHKRGGTETGASAAIGRLSDSSASRTKHWVTLTSDQMTGGGNHHMLTIRSEVTPHRGSQSALIWFTRHPSPLLLQRAL